MEQLKAISSFLSENWIVITMIVTAVVWLVQMITKHFSEYKGVKKVGMFIIDLLSPVTSRDSSKSFKIPFISSKPEPGKQSKKKES